MKATYIHYDNGKDYDVIDFIQDYKLGFNRGNIIKYIVRAGKKQDELKDLEKALDYLQREINYLRQEQEIWLETNTL
jgi:hypothetical protein